MASINGFKYEPWESSSAVARRDFRHSNDEMEEKYWKGSQRQKASPNKKNGCPENDNNNHVFVVIQYNHQVSYGGGKTHEYTTYRKECVGCGKVKKHLYNYHEKPFQVVDVMRDFSWMSSF